ncbi:MAG: hypothetical protein IIV11_03205 [Clostridia bacterium]|nr:hypothetical protein [Clostridia bacterium]
MRDQKYNKDSELLLEAIGEIDDRFIFEAESYERKKSSLPLRKLIIAAVALSLVFTFTLSLGIGLMLGSSRDKVDNDSAGAPNEDQDGADGNFGDADADDNIKPGVQPIVTLSDTLHSVKFSSEGFSTTFERDMLFDGSTKLIWKYSDEESYRVCTISSASDTKSIQRALEHKKDFSEVSEPAVDSIDGFWICFGDGLVYTPYLKSSDGNVGYGELFDYEQELEPSKSFATFISEIIKKESN